MRAKHLVPVCVVLILVALEVPARAASGSLDAVIEPLGPTPTQQQFNASWSGLGSNPIASVYYDDNGTTSPIWTTSSGSKTVYHTYPCITSDLSRNPYLAGSGGGGQILVTDRFTQKKTYSTGRCPP